MKRSEQKIRTRTHLLKIAGQAFSKRGFLNTNTLDIAKEAGVSHGTLFVHFPTREDLLFKVIEEFGLQMGSKFQQLTANKVAPHEILTAHLAMIEEYESFYTHLVTEGAMLPSSIRQRIFLIQSGFAHHLESSLKGREGLPPLHFILNSWLGLIHYYLTNRDLFAPGKSVIATHGPQLIKQFTQTFNL